MLLMTVDNTDNRRVSGNVYQDLKPSGELSSVKAGCWVRRGVLGKAPIPFEISGSPGTYPTFNRRFV